MGLCLVPACTLGMQGEDFSDATWHAALLCGTTQDKMRELGGRPHWAKLHNLEHDAISQLYDLERFNRLRRLHDPDNMFGAAPYIQTVLGSP